MKYGGDKIIHKKDINLNIAEEADYELFDERINKC